MSVATASSYRELLELRARPFSSLWPVCPSFVRRVRCGGLLLGHPAARIGQRQIPLRGRLGGLEKSHHSLGEIRRAGTRDSRNEKRRTPVIQCLSDRYRLRRGLFRRQQVALVEHQPARLAHRSSLNLPSSPTMDRASRTGSAAGIHRQDVDQVQQHARALQVLQETDAEPCTVGRAFDEAGNIGHDEAALIAAGHHAEIRVQRGERIVGDLRSALRIRSKSASTCRRSAGLTSPRRR